jgi:hypothetical protein
MSRSASAAPRSPATVEKRTNTLGLLADLGEDLGLGVLGDVVGDGEGAEGARALGVHAPLGDDLAVKMRQLFQEPDILQQHRAARAGGHGVLVVRDGRTGSGGQSCQGGISKAAGCDQRIHYLTASSPAIPWQTACF